MSFFCAKKQAVKDRPCIIFVFAGLSAVQHPNCRGRRPRRPVKQRFAKPHYNHIHALHSEHQMLKQPTSGRAQSSEQSSPLQMIREPSEHHNCALKSVVHNDRRAHGYLVVYEFCVFKRHIDAAVRAVVFVDVAAESISPLGVV